MITGVLTFSDALKLVKLRAEWMESLLGHGYGMGVIEGISEKNIRAMVDAAYIRGEEAYISSINSADQITISGKIEHIHNLFSEARGAGARRAQLIKVPVPSHCSLLANISIRLQEAMSHIPLGEPQFPYVANTNARLLRDAASICHDLAQGVSHPVRWYPSTIHLYERGVRLFVEMPPGQVLTNLVRADFKLARAVAMQETSIQSVLHLIHSKKRIYDQSNNTP
ncbi:Malonyl CoA-acyl carrier protein transacylase [compost metagenome]